MLIVCVPSFAAEFDITVLDRYGEPVPGVAVYIEPGQDAGGDETTALAEMQQADFQFRPDLLIVQKGTRVQFPNTDTVAHHVYSFSKPNNFVLPMYKVDRRPQVTFEYAGVVAVGCNLHDQMVGYILVVESRIFGKTDRDGKLRLEADNPHGITVNIWNPRFRLDREELAQPVKAGRSARLTFLLKEELRSSFAADREVYSWTEEHIR